MAYFLLMYLKLWLLMIARSLSVSKAKILNLKIHNLMAGDAPGPKLVRVCAQQIHNENCCAWSDNIYVKRCSDFASREYFVYQLKNLPYCDMAYCAGSGQYCPGDSSFNTFIGNCSCEFEMRSLLYSE